MKTNLPNPKLLIFSKPNAAPISRTGRYPIAMCLQGVGVSSILCARFNIWCHKSCPGLNTFAGVQKCICLMCDGTLARTASHVNLKLLEDYRETDRRRGRLTAFVTTWQQRKFGRTLRVVVRGGV